MEEAEDVSQAEAPILELATADAPIGTENARGPLEARTVGRLDLRSSIA